MRSNTPIRAPIPDTGPLGLNLLVGYGYDKLEQADLASLLLSAISLDERDPVAGILREASDEAMFLSEVLEKDADAGIAETGLLQGRLLSISRRIAVANELHRRMMQERATAENAAPELIAAE